MIRRQTPSPHYPANGSACAAGSLEPSHVAAAIGLGEPYRLGVIRFSIGRDTTDAEIDETLRRLTAIMASMGTPLIV